MEYIKEFKDIYYPKIDNQNYALIEAVENGDIKEIRKLIDEGADVNFQDAKYGWTPIMYCKYYSSMIELIRFGADLNIQSNDGLTVLMINSYDKKTKEMKKLISSGANMYLKNNKGQDFYDVAIEPIKKWIRENYPEFISNRQNN